MLVAEMRKHSSHGSLKSAFVFGEKYTHGKLAEMLLIQPITTTTPWVTIMAVKLLIVERGAFARVNEQHNMRCIVAISYRR